jgi:hypothetical protein
MPSLGEGETQSFLRAIGIMIPKFTPEQASYKKPGVATGLLVWRYQSLLFEEAEFFVEARYPATTIQNGLGAAGPCGMGARVNIQ